MNTEYQSLKAFFLAPSLPVGISFTGHLKLHEMTHSRLRFGINATPFVTVPIMVFYSLNHDKVVFMSRGLGDVHAALLVNWTYRGYFLSVRERSAQWQLEVWDTGVGIANNEHESIYSPHYRGEHAWRADATGHGLGLHVVARCAKLPRAQQGLTSRLGRVSRFWLRLDCTNWIRHIRQCSALIEIGD